METKNFFHDLTEDIEPLKNQVFFVQKILERSSSDSKVLISCKIGKEDAEEKLFKFSEKDFQSIKENFIKKGERRFRLLELENGGHVVYLFKKF